MNNAYVSGTREGKHIASVTGAYLMPIDLELFGNEYVQLTSIFTVGYATYDQPQLLESPI